MIETTARTTAGTSVEVLALDTRIRYRTIEPGTHVEVVRHGTITARNWAFDLFDSYIVDGWRTIAPDRIERVYE